MKRYPKYKDSGVPWLGQVPEHWVTTKLSRLIDPRRRITYGIVQAGENVPGGVKYIRPVDMTDSNGVKDESLLRTTSYEIAEQYRRSAVKTGDVVFSIGPSYGKVMIVPSSLAGANLTQGTARLAPANVVKAQFLFYALQSAFCKSQWDVSIGGATFGGLNLQPLARTLLVLPPRTEQDAITQHLRQVCESLDHAISSQELMIELLKERRSAIITQAVTKGLNPKAKMKDSGVPWLGQVPAHWELLRFKNLFCEMHLRRGCELPAGSISYGKVVFKDDQDVHGPTKESYQAVLRGDFLINPINLNYDLKSLRTALSEIDVCVSPAYIVLKASRRESPHYLRHLLYAFDLHHMKTLGSGVRHTITFDDIGSCVAVAPPISEQEAIASFLGRQLSQIDSAISSQERMIELLKERRSAIITQAVTGQIDVR